MVEIIIRRRHNSWHRMQVNIWFNEANEQPIEQDTSFVVRSYEAWPTKRSINLRRNEWTKNAVATDDSALSLTEEEWE